MNAPWENAVIPSRPSLKGFINYQILCAVPVENGERKTSYKYQVLGGRPFIG
jgi:hypothetical protein